MKKSIGLFLVLTVITGVILFSGFISKTDYTKIENGLQIGQTAPDFNLKNIDSKMVSLSGISNSFGDKHKGFIVIFTCNTCPYAVMYEDRIIELHNKYASQGWPVVAIQPNDVTQKPGDSFEEMKVRAKDKGFPFVYLIDEKQEVYPAYGATRTPHVFLLDKNRVVRYIGAIDNNPQDAEAVTEPYVENAISAIGKGKDPSPDVTKAIGCGIKAKQS
jgi:peroxiredoxin